VAWYRTSPLVTYPRALKPDAGFLLAGALAVSILVAVLDYQMQTVPSVAATDRKRFLTQLQDRYRRRREDALSGAVRIALGLQAHPEAVSAAARFQRARLR
jgi:hypothetical protein